MGLGAGGAGAAAAAASSITYKSLISAPGKLTKAITWSFGGTCLLGSLTRSSVPLHLTV